MPTDSTPHDTDRDLHGEQVSLTGLPVLDDQHHEVGTVSDVLYDERGDPRWAVVDPGPLRAEKFVPVDGAYMTAGGDVVIPYDKDQVKQSPKAGRDHVLDAETERRLVDHYDVH